MSLLTHKDMARQRHTHDTGSTTCRMSPARTEQRWPWVCEARTHTAHNRSAAHARSARTHSAHAQSAHARSARCEQARYSSTRTQRAHTQWHTHGDKPNLLAEPDSEVADYPPLAGRKVPDHILRGAQRLIATRNTNDQSIKHGPVIGECIC